MIGFICFLLSAICFAGSAFYNQWWHNSFILYHVGKRPQIMWTSQVGFLTLEEDFNILSAYLLRTCSILSLLLFFPM
jgi:hypothetical protein